MTTKVTNFFDERQFDHCKFKAIHRSSQFLFRLLTSLVISGLKQFQDGGAVLGTNYFA